MPRPTRRARLTAPGLSARLLRVRKVMGSPSCDFWGAAVVDWVRILDNSDDDGDFVDDRESKDMCEASDDDDESSPRRDAVLLLFDIVLQVAATDERDLVILLVVFFAETRAAHLMARDAPDDIIFLGC
mmetsp:Transcript_28837/g.42393  ORF Transcript_28837/g.42393 Transcript_28837/m.42393 type:complete len:129 (-) Transcript_28837:54-440(-)|eukprot:scaffold3285_cov128-Skeletonema_dohrnii-CCMP3373.AAC.2